MKTTSSCWNLQLVQLQLLWTVTSNTKENFIRSLVSVLLWWFECTRTPHVTHTDIGGTSDHTRVPVERKEFQCEKTEESGGGALPAPLVLLSPDSAAVE